MTPNNAIKLDAMPTRTRHVYQALAKEPLMDGFVLIGGTALSIQIGHRLSEDLDFWLPAAAMSKERVDAILTHLGAQGMHHEFATPAWKLTQARINGIDLLAQSRDHVVDGVKVTFFARDDTPYRHFAGMKRIAGKAGFEIAHKDTIFAMKSWLISQRIRSRDLFDLMTLMQRGKTLQDILDTGAQADPAWQREFAKEVLVGNVPLDADDEGFDSIGLAITVEDIHRFFLEAVNQYEVDVAAGIRRGME
jgi:predicted nucleotidyltransferase component of viral defense system